MKTLYTRIVLTVFFILLASGAIALLVSNVAYYVWWQPSYSEKTERTASTAIGYFENHTDQDEAAYYSLLARTGYQLLVVKADGRIMRYGGEFRNETMDDEVIRSVRDGNVYEGMRDYPFHLFLLGLFDNEVVNTYGFPLTGSDGVDAVFMRPDLSAQIRELHLFVGLFFATLTVLAFLLIALATRNIVRPVKALTFATASVASGTRPRDLPLERSDEIGVLARRFDDMAETLEKSEAERKRFVSNVSHEFRSPLTSLTGYATRLVETTDGEANDYARIIRDETERLSGLTTQLLLLARLDEADITLETDIVLADSIEDVIRGLSFQLDQTGVAISTDLDASIIIKGDPLLLSQVWANLLQNALHASPEGGLIRVRLEQLERPTVTITDDGTGMDEATKTRLFERFFQGDVSRSTTGTGLGLSIVHDIVALHRGTIHVDSTPGRGTVFTITL
ncbi:HAMP domain-containing sensor histidine kinase [Exiguobacterium sp.]|uniref:sensor histidine kinase n=1 Tax=Exiguobacterium sp. TaxID=44751 RepID=UPI00263A717A|nr:HAMP domain-containing sensor histidine kinase [Exiguobacterium sp.]MCC5891207.1 HAMP domain-containing histidine kinase [Exiguobacterium sp.]